MIYRLAVLSAVLSGTNAHLRRHLSDYPSNCKGIAHTPWQRGTVCVKTSGQAEKVCMDMYHPGVNECTGYLTNAAFHPEAPKELRLVTYSEENFEGDEHWHTNGAYDQDIDVHSYKVDTIENLLKHGEACFLIGGNGTPICHNIDSQVVTFDGIDLFNGGEMYMHKSVSLVVKLKVSHPCATHVVLKYGTDMSQFDFTSEAIESIQIKPADYTLANDIGLCFFMGESFSGYEGEARCMSNPTEAEPIISEVCPFYDKKTVAIQLSEGVIVHHKEEGKVFPALSGKAVLYKDSFEIQDFEYSQDSIDESGRFLYFADNLQAAMQAREAEETNERPVCIFREDNRQGPMECVEAKEYNNADVELYNWEHGAIKSIEALQKDGESFEVTMSVEDVDLATIQAVDGLDTSDLEAPFTGNEETEYKDVDEFTFAYVVNSGSESGSA